ncbi:MAG: sugar phosphate isomerase/epimerase family protein [Sphingomonas oligoaromativorans]
MMDRRTFLAATAALAAAPAFAKAAARGGKPVGLQLYTLRTLFQADPVKTLTQVARIGYQEIEYGGGGYDAMDHAMLRRTTDRLGLKAPSAHIPYDLLANHFDQSVKMARTLGADTVVMPFIDQRLRTEEGWREVVATMNRIAPQLRSEGFTFAYHNHDFEFTTEVAGSNLYERLIHDTDPALVKFEIDLYWAVKAKQDPKALIRRLAGRVHAYHVKDMKPDGSMTSVGSGTIDFADIFRLNSIAGVKHFFVENDECPVPYIPDVTTSFNNLSRLLGR